jgi:hypothetical protein
VVLDRGLEGDRVGTDDLTHFLAVLEEHEGRHGAHGEFLGDVGDGIDVELEEAGIGVLAGESTKQRVSYRSVLFVIELFVLTFRLEER